MTPHDAVTSRFAISPRNLLLVMAALCILPGIVTVVYLWHVKSLDHDTKFALHPYGGVYSMASALHRQRTGQSKGWFFVAFLNHVEAVDLSPHNWAATKRRGKTRAVDDSALSILRDFHALRSLDLRDTQVTDNGLRHIKALSRLERLDIRGTRITEDGLQQLRAALPECKIDR